MILANGCSLCHHFFMRPKKLTILLSFWAVITIIELLIFLVMLYNKQNYYFNILPPEKRIEYSSTFITLFGIPLLGIIFILFQSYIIWALWRGINRVNWLFAFAILNLLSIPIGTALGIATIVILRSKEVKAYFKIK